MAFNVTAINASTYDIGGETVNMTAAQVLDLFTIGDRDDFANSTTLAGEILAGNVTVAWNGVNITNTALPSVNDDNLVGSEVFQDAVDTVVNGAGSAIGSDINDLVTLTGVAENSTDLGTFTGSTIPDAQTIKAALQSLETAVESAGTQETFVVADITARDALTPNTADIAYVTDASADATVTAGAAVYVWDGSAWQKITEFESLDVTIPVDSVFGRTGAVVADNGDYTASQVTNVPSGNLAAVTVQAALDELQTDVDTRAVDSTVVHLAGAESITGVKTFTAQPAGIAAGSIVNTPAGDIAATTVQAAIDELDSEKQADVITTQGDVIRGNASGAAERLALGNAGELLGSDGTDTVYIARPYGQEFFLLENNSIITQAGGPFTDVINSSVNIATTGKFKITVSFPWNVDDTTNDIRVTLLFDGSTLGQDDEFHRQEPKDAAGTGAGSLSGTGTNQVHAFTKVYYVDVATAGSKAVLMQFRGGGSVTASIWDTNIEVVKVSN
jgi:hypothetical protein